MKREFGIEAEIIKGSGGAFEVLFDDELIYSKKATGRHVEPGQIEGLIQARLDMAT